MNKNFTMAFSCIIAFIFGLGINNIAMSDIDINKIAYVDVNKLVASSNIIKQAQNIRDIQTREMLNWYDNANTEIQKQKTKETKDMLIKTYESQLQQKKKTIKENYTREVKKADNQMDSVIKQKAKELGYVLVFKKESLLYGGEDITSQILPLVK